MGVMDAGIFENDAALDMLGDVEKVAVSEIEAFVKAPLAGIEELDMVAACMAIHIALIRGCPGVPPSVSFADAVAEKLLRIFDAEADELKPPAEFKARRREVLAKLVLDYRGLAQADDE